MNYMRMNDGYVYVYQGVKGIKMKEHTCSAVLDGWCMRYGSSYEGRRDAAMKFLHKKQLVPIYVKEDTIVFPAYDVCGDPLWINYVHLAKLEKKQKDETTFIFYDGSFIASGMPYKSIVKQILYTQLWMYAMLGYCNEDLKTYVH